ncbi:carbon-nitrogen hydrolase family protein [Actinoplanes sp. CA-030573]|uniref:carbon-nitrogen hydrolase family protein n=1 Tax=Actinoplanes sp. CA-030573 TaxID=3239898 RepID=UPI003D900E8D
MRIAACQTPEILGDVDSAIAVVRDFAARTEDADLLLFPECFLQGYLVTGQHVRDTALELGSAELDDVLARIAVADRMLVLGIIERAGRRFFNTALVVSGGRVLGAYRKMFLTAGESVFTAGDGYPVFECAGVRFGLNICFDAQYPQAARAVAAAGARVVLQPAQNMMRRASALAWEHRHNAVRARRVRETGLWWVSADVTGERDGSRVGLGPTAVIDPSGRVVAQVPAGEIGFVTAEI